MKFENLIASVFIKENISEYSVCKIEANFCPGLNVLTQLWPNEAILTDIDSSSGLVPDSTKPLPELMLTYRECGSVSPKAISTESTQDNNW